MRVGIVTHVFDYQGDLPELGDDGYELVLELISLCGARKESCEKLPVYDARSVSYMGNVDVDVLDIDDDALREVINAAKEKRTRNARYAGRKMSPIRIGNKKYSGLAWSDFEKMHENMSYQRLIEDMDLVLFKDGKSVPMSRRTLVDRVSKARKLIGSGEFKESDLFVRVINESMIFAGRK